MKNSLTKKLLALVLAVLLLVGTIPVLAIDGGEAPTIPTVVVKVGYTGTEGDPVNYASDLGTDGEALYKTYSTITKAIDSFQGEEGKVWVYGTFEGSGPDFEGTTADREPITIAAFNNDATKGGIKINATQSSAKASNKEWMKGDITFEYLNITSAAASDNLGPKYAFASSNGYELTLGEGLVMPNNTTVGVGSSTHNGTSDQKVNIYSGTYNYVGSIGVVNSANKVMNFNSEINIYGGNLALTGGTGYMTNLTDDPGYNTLNGDYKVNVYGGELRSTSVIASTRLTDMLILGDTIYDIKGGKLLSRISFGFHLSGSNTITGRGDYQAPTNRGNIAVIIDFSKVTYSYDKMPFNFVNGDSNVENFVLGTGKRAIAIINNATQNDQGFYKANFGTGTNTAGKAYDGLYRLHYKITVLGGEAYPVFERENPSDPASSYLKGFTIESSTDSTLSPYVGETKIPVVDGYTYEGKTVYDLTAFMSDGVPYEDGTNTNDDRTITNITFVDDSETDTPGTDPENPGTNPENPGTNPETPPVGEVNTSAVVVKVGYTGTEGSAVDYATELGTTEASTIYATYSNITAAINSFNGEEGKVWILGTYNGSGPDFEGTVTNRKHITIAGFNNDATKGGININATQSSAKASNKEWMKGDITFEHLNITSAEASDNTGPKYAFASSNGYELTLGEGLVMPDNSTVGVGSSTSNGTSDQKVNIHSGTYNFVGSVGVVNSANKVLNFNSEINIYGGNLALTGGTGFMSSTTDDPGYNTLNGDYKVNVYGGELRSTSVISSTRLTDMLILGDTIYNIKGGKLLSRISFGFYYNGSNTLTGHGDYQAPTNRGNIAVIIDFSKVTYSYDKMPFNYIYGDSNVENFVLDTGKRAIAIINNATKNDQGFNKTTFGTSTNTAKKEYNGLYRLHYKITVLGGEAYPVFERTNPSDPASSYLKGFTIESSTDSTLSPYVGSQKIPVVEGYTYEGKTVYDLTAFMSDGVPYEEGTNTNDDGVITNITFEAVEEPDNGSQNNNNQNNNNQNNNKPNNNQNNGTSGDSNQGNNTQNNNNQSNNQNNGTSGDSNQGNNTQNNNAGNVQDPVGDIGDQNGGVVTLVQQNDMTTVLIVAIAVLALLMLAGNALILFIVLKGKRMRGK